MTNPLSATTAPSGASIGKIVIGAILALVIGGFFLFDLGQFLTLRALQEHRNFLLAYTDTHYAAAAAVFVALYIVIVGLSLPGATIMTLAGGFLFGSLWGTLLANLGATTGATLAFLAARYLLHDWVERRFGHMLGPIQAGFAKDAFSYLMTLRLIPLFPFFLVNMVSGLTRVSPGTYVAATALGIIPGSFVFAYAGRQLGAINSLQEIASLNVLLAFTLLGLLALVPVLYRRMVNRPA
ncbi:MAG: TVP38/TMEM64 family protein [Nitrospira sp.]|nr:TVP38/TMEM64 family protein [Nitrospira sp.]